ncbi:hypothetical protein L484_008804 [Morus notabilis]|uniref:Uncharacterized protein n=1 Tax=Morus notabilis TaxID=981085 RepID=W9QZH3_9ROSA|nr:hypothetical protein L484_008804 [Morus notabilis]
MVRHGATARQCMRESSVNKDTTNLMIGHGPQNIFAFAMDKCLSSFGTLTKIGVSDSLEGSSASGLREVPPREPSVPPRLVDLAEKSDVYLHDKDFLSLFDMKQNPNSGGRSMFVPRKKHVIVIEEVKLANREWNSRYAMVCRVIDDAGSPWIDPKVWGRSTPVKGENLSAMDMIGFIAAARSTGWWSFGQVGWSNSGDRSYSSFKGSSADKRKMVEEFQLELPSDLSTAQIERAFLTEADLELLMKEDPMLLVNETSADGISMSRFSLL